MQIRRIEFLPEDIEGSNLFDDAVKLGLLDGTYQAYKAGTVQFILIHNPLHAQIVQASA